uniref:MAK10-like protein n=1 Tax=Tanacetum cinerariifolium TaxID=118510 RepID=A0A6L2NHA0_TANCI|nr:MAK10-like protein [Tanacetum cinerariifolium]
MGVNLIPTLRRDLLGDVKIPKRCDAFDGVAGRTTKLRNDILIFQQHHDLIFFDHVSYPLKCQIDYAVGGKLRDKSVEESWELIEDLALYDNESWNDPKYFTKLVKAITFPQDVPSTSDRHLVELENQVQLLMEAHIPPQPSVQVNKIASSCEICGGPHDTQYCIENPDKLLLIMHPHVTTKREVAFGFDVSVYFFDIYNQSLAFVAPPSPDYVPWPEHPPSPDYVPGPEHPPLPIEIPYVPEPEYPEYLAPYFDEAPLEDQPLPSDASPIAASPDYVADSDPEKYPEEDPKDNQADYPADGGDG